jgi:hypothetical protein
MTRRQYKTRVAIITLLTFSKPPMSSQEALGTSAKSSQETLGTSAIVSRRADRVTGAQRSLEVPIGSKHRIEDFSNSFNIFRILIFFCMDTKDFQSSHFIGNFNINFPIKPSKPSKSWVNLAASLISLMGASWYMVLVSSVQYQSLC